MAVACTQRTMGALLLTQITLSQQLDLCGSHTTTRKLRDKMLEVLTDPALIAAVIAAVRKLHACTARASPPPPARLPSSSSTSAAAQLAAQERAAGVVRNGPIDLGALAKANCYAHHISFDMLSWSTHFMFDIQCEQGQATQAAPPGHPSGGGTEAAPPAPPPLGRRKLLVALEATDMVTVLVAALIDGRAAAGGRRHGSEAIAAAGFKRAERGARSGHDQRLSSGRLREARRPVASPAAGGGTRAACCTRARACQRWWRGAARALRLLLAPTMQRFTGGQLERFCLHHLRDRGGGAVAGRGGGARGRSLARHAAADLAILEKLLASAGGGGGSGARGGSFVATATWQPHVAAQLSADLCSTGARRRGAPVWWPALPHPPAPHAAGHSDVPVAEAGGVDMVMPRVCSNLRCGNFSCLAESQLQLLQCGSCRLVRCCSRECHQEDWRSGHEEVCPGRRLPVSSAAGGG